MAKSATEQPTPTLMSLSTVTNANIQKSTAEQPMPTLMSLSTVTNAKSTVEQPMPMLKSPSTLTNVNKPKSTTEQSMPIPHTTTNYDEWLEYLDAEKGYYGDMCLLKLHCFEDEILDSMNTEFCVLINLILSCSHLKISPDSSFFYFTRYSISTKLW